MRLNNSTKCMDSTRMNNPRGFEDYDTKHSHI
jgi:hypothetical protein